MYYRKMKHWSTLAVLSLTSMIFLVYLFSDLLQSSTFRTKNSLFSLFRRRDGYILGYSLPSVRTSCPIFTYYQSLPELGNPLVIQVLNIWGNAFYAQGFRPVILNRTHAEKRANFMEISKRFSRFPSINPAEYELSCYLRWIALVEQGGGLLMDYDILPMTSSQSKDIRDLKECKWGNLTMYASMSPMMTHGNATEIERWVNYMVNFELKDVATIHGRPHTSDMIMAAYSINHNQSVFAEKSTLPFFHYSSHTRHSMFAHIKRTTAEIMTRTQHIYHFSHHDIYVPISPSVAPYSEQIIRAIALCQDSTPAFDDLDSFCTSKNKFVDICKLITVDGSWSPDDPHSGKCTWKTGPPDNQSKWGILQSGVQKKEPLVIAVLPQPKTYRWRLWSSINPLFSNRTNNETQEFRSWVLHQPTTLMLNTLIPTSANTLNVDDRITRTINAMRSGQALLITEAFAVQLYQSEGKEGVEKWISAHLGFFLHIKELDFKWEQTSFIDIESQLFADDERFYFAIHKENERWTEHWNSWRTTFLSVHSERRKTS